MTEDPMSDLPDTPPATDLLEPPDPPGVDDAPSAVAEPPPIEAADPMTDVAAAAPGGPVADPAAPDGPIADPAGLAATEAAAADRAATAAAVALAMVSAKAKADGIAAAAAAVPLPPEPTAADQAEYKRQTRRAAIRGTIATLIRGVAVLALFVGGIALGGAAFQRSDQAAGSAVVVDPAVDGAQPPAIVQEFVTALAAGDADSLRSSLQAEPHARLTSEFRRFDIQSISAVDTLGTHVDGARSATEVVMRGTTTAGAPISLNLIILTDGNTIEGFR